MKNALNNQVGMLGDMFLWLVANLTQGVIYFIKQALAPNISAGSVLTPFPRVLSISGFIKVIRDPKPPRRGVNQLPQKLSSSITFFKSLQMGHAMNLLNSKG